MTDPTSPAHWMAAFREAGPHTIHGVGHSEEVVRAIEEAAFGLGMPLARIDGSAVTGTEDLFERIGKQMAFPYPCRSWNVLIDMLSSLDDYMPGKPGYVLLIERADRFPGARQHVENAFRTLVEILPGVSHRWQIIGPRFHAVLTGSGRMRARAARVIARENERGRKAYSMPWDIEAGRIFHPSALLDHGDPEPAGTGGACRR